MEIEVDAATFGDLLTKFQEHDLVLKLVSIPDEPGSFMLIARPR